MKVEYITHSGSDLLIANAARVSLDKHHEEFTEKDARLIGYLAKHNHWTPFGHPHITLRVTVPIFVANQLKRHTVGLIVNEVSRRYVDSEPEFYFPDKFGKRAPNKKQGALEDGFIYLVFENEDYVISANAFLKAQYNSALWAYKSLLAEGVAPEDARMVLPLSTYTSWYWTGSLYAYARIYNLRSKSDAQRQTQEIAKMISDVIEPLFPYSWPALTKDDSA